MNKQKRKKAEKPTLPDAILSRYNYTLAQFRKRCNFLGLLLATSTFTASLTPSLIPRPWYLQGLIAGIAIVIGYYTGTTLSILVRKFVAKEFNRSIKGVAWVLLSLWIVVAAAYELASSVLYQQKINLLVNNQSESNTHVIWTIFAVLVTTAIIAYVLIILTRFMRKMYFAIAAYFLKTRIVKMLPKAVYRTAIALVIALAISYLATDAGLRFLRDTANAFFKTNNAVISDRFERPSTQLISGSEDSLVSWESLGAPGRRFVSAPPSIEMLQDFHGKKDVKQPIRIYIGIDASTNIREQARLAVKELERTNAFDRKVVQVINTTGSGGIDLDATRPLEYMYEGDVATVAIQYSYFPSWLSLVTDKERARTAAAELTNQINASRTKYAQKNDHVADIFLFGESLGSYGIESAFPTTSELSGVAQKTMLVGPPGFNPIRKDFTRSGTGDATVAFVSDIDTVKDRIGPETRLAYLENPTDPVTKWDPEMIWRQPKWIHQQRERSNDEFKWYPVVSFVQVSVDMALALDVPVGYGHRYGVQSSRVWAELANPPNWTDVKQQKLELTLLSFYF